jgi:enamine deaminase RidA (YjgF/YER057c/UK114 family)
MRKQLSTGTPWEDVVGYSRAIRIGNVIEVAGTTAMDGSTLIGKNDLYAQTKFILEKIETILVQMNSSMKDVVRTRMYVTDISTWEAAGKAHGEYFKNIKPVTTMVEISRLISDDLLIEIEVTAMID